MSLGERLREAVGKEITDLCPNRFHDDHLNHCAHFASHMCGLAFSYSCVDFKGGTGPEANIRVHEVFAQCPRVGKWEDADPARAQLIFVTRKEHVDLPHKRMQNHPQKHVGVYHDGTVYHYGNSRDQVVTDTPQSFLEKFQAIYAGDQGIFFGWIPGENLLLRVAADAVGVSAVRKFEIPDPVEGHWKARLLGDQDWFIVGDETRNQSRRFYGLYTPTRDYWGPVYRSEEYHSRLDHWANLLEVTGACESENRFNLVNTYDRAKFTFGFYQLAAHTPRDNLILLFRRLSELAAFRDYFSDLELANGRLTRVDTDGSRTDLEAEFPTGPGGDEQLQLFMNYLNPNRQVIERQEALQAARLIHWAVNDPEMRLAQVTVSAEILQSKMARRYTPKVGLDGRSDTLCAIVADIFHQGRSDYATVRAILQASNAEEALLTLNDSRYRNRNRNLRRAISKAKAEGKLGEKIYVAATNEFRPRVTRSTTAGRGAARVDRG